MKRPLVFVGALLVLTLALWSGPQVGGPSEAFAQRIDGYDFRILTLFDSDSLGGFTTSTLTDSSNTDSVKIGRSQFFGLAYRADVDGADGDSVNYIISIYVSMDGTNFVQPEAIAPVIKDLPAVTDTLWHIRSIKIPPVPYVKFYWRKLAGSADSTSANLLFYSQPPMWSHIGQ